MKNLLKFLILASLVSCNEDLPFETGVFPEDPVNLIELNTQYDEMNSNYVPSTLNQEAQFIFSSNSKKMEKDFDFEARFLSFLWDKEVGTLTHRILNNNTEGYTDFYNKVQELQSDCNEKGPYSYYEKRGAVGLRFMIYSKDCGGNYKIVGREFSGPSFSNRLIPEESSFRLFEDNSNEMYPSFMGKNFSKELSDSKIGKPDQLIFSSDKSGNFKLYQLKIPSSQNPFDFLISASPKEISMIKEIKSEGNDHAPFISGEALLFASDRAGGYGGYDLYYSTFVGGKWADPVNLGPKINSEFDEFRPITIHEEYSEFENQLLIFSSNRPGGLGGFDLYYVGIPTF
jgi:hypothetical protein